MSGERDLAVYTFLEEVMTPNKCERLCSSRNLSYFGLQYTNECRCDNTFNKYGSAPEKECNTPCDGDISFNCGGSARNSVYRVTNRAPSFFYNYKDGRPLIGVVMMVKNEAHTLSNTLVSLKPFIDSFYILDTGSTDSTIEVIQSALKGLNVHIYQEPFIDYGATRNRILDLTAQSENPPIFSLMLSADETVYNVEALFEYCSFHRDLSGTNEEAYAIVMDVGWKFDSLRLSRTDSGWRYVGRVHEYLASKDTNYHATPRLPLVWIKFTVTDHERRLQREHIILKILLEEKELKPYDHRTSFYLARTYNAIANHSAALNEFRRRVSLGGWHEEVYESLYAIAWQLSSLGRDWHEVEAAFIDAHDYSSDRAEPLYYIAEHYLRERKYSLALMFAQRAAQIPYPSHAILWVQASVYKFQSHSLVAQAAIEVNQPRLGLDSLVIAMKEKPKDQTLEVLINRYRHGLGKETFNNLYNSILFSQNITFKPKLNLNEISPFTKSDNHWSTFQMFLFFCVNLVCFIIIGSLILIWKRSKKQRRIDRGLYNIV